MACDDCVMAEMAEFRQCDGVMARNRFALCHHPSAAARAVSPRQPMFPLKMFVLFPLVKGHPLRRIAGKVCA
jgi:hypothetical protein